MPLVGDKAVGKVCNQDGLRFRIFLKAMIFFRRRIVIEAIFKAQARIPLGLSLFYRCVTSFLVSWGVVWRFFIQKAWKIGGKILTEITSKYMENPWTSFKLLRKSVQHRPKTVLNRERCVLGPFSAPNRAQVGPRMARARKTTPPLEAFWRKMVPQGSILGPLQNRKSLPKRVF